MIDLTIDGIAIESPEGTTILQAADAAGMYIPRLCAHPDLPPIDPGALKPWDVVYWGPVAQEHHTDAGGHLGCELCLVAVDGTVDPVRACATPAVSGMEITTAGADLVTRRRTALRRILAKHPHACVQCAQRVGCALEPCSTNVAKEERCCAIFHRCELRKVAEYVGIPEDTPRYRPAGHPVIVDGPLFRWDTRLCIGCLRCVRMCRDVRGIDALGFVLQDDGTPMVGLRAPTLADSGCQYCLGCVEVCPTGTLQLTFAESRVSGGRSTKCAAGCPANMDIPRYVREIRRGAFGRAEAVIREAAPLPRVLGQVCFHPCEEHCLRGALSDPVAICALKRAAVEHADEAIWRSRAAPAPPTGKTVAVVGSGPAGLTAAWFLRLKGHGVVVYESEALPGGWLRDGIPPFRLSRSALDADVADILSIGVELQTGIQIGRDRSMNELRGAHDAVFLAVGARSPKTLRCDGTDLDGVESGLALLKRVAAGAASRTVFDGLSVVVVGGGNVAIDVARTALRLQAGEVHLFCLEGREEMPAYAWEIAEAEREGVVFHTGWGPYCITGGGKVERVEFSRCLSVYDDAGGFAPRLDHAERQVQPADRVLIAIGQVPELGFLAAAEGLAVRTDHYVNVDAESLRTSIDGVFAGGEVVSGPASVVEAVGHGRRAAAAIDRYLGGDGDIFVPLLDETPLDVELDRSVAFATLGRTPTQRFVPEAAENRLAMLESGYDVNAARQEAARCLGCDLRLAIRPVVPPPEPWLAFTRDAVRSVPESSGVYQLLDEEKQPYAIKGVPNLKAALTEIADGGTEARFFLFDEDPMYTKRESELIQRFLQEHGHLPPGEGEDDLDDLF